MKNLEKKSEELNSKASKLLDDSKLIEILNKYGTVEIVGSYRYGLMTKNDIDIYVINQNVDRELAAKALTEIIQENYFRGYLFCNWKDTKPPAWLPEGYYIGLKYGGYGIYAGTKWKIDIWFLDEAVPDIKGIDDLSASQRETILHLKTERDAQGLDIMSYQIYKAVIERGIKNLNDLL